MSIHQKSCINKESMLRLYAVVLTCVFFAGCNSSRSVAHSVVETPKPSTTASTPLKTVSSQRYQAGFGYFSPSEYPSDTDLSSVFVGNAGIEKILIATALSQDHKKAFVLAKKLSESEPEQIAELTSNSDMEMDAISIDGGEIVVKSHSAYGRKRQNYYTVVKGHLVKDKLRSYWLGEDINPKEQEAEHEALDSVTTPDREHPAIRSIIENSSKEVSIRKCEVAWKSFDTNRATLFLSIENHTSYPISFVETGITLRSSVYSGLYFVIPKRDPWREYKPLLPGPIAPNSMVWWIENIHIRDFTNEVSCRLNFFGGNNGIHEL